MANSLVQLQALQLPGEILHPQGGSRYEQYKEDGIYEYPIVNGRKNRHQVKITYNLGDVYEGGIKHGKQSGTGKYSWKDGGTYEGEFKKGKLTGHGKYTATDGETYEGEFKNNKYSGNGKYIWSDGSSFEGKFENGKMISGKYKDTNGNEFTCKFTYKLNGEHKNSVVQLTKQAKAKEDPKQKAEKGANPEDKPKKKTGATNGLLQKDKNLISMIKNSKRGADFKNLYSGSNGKSEKECKQLIAIINFFNNSDSEQIQRILKSSKLYDAGKDQDYYVGLISGIISDQKNVTDVAKQVKKRTQTKGSVQKGEEKGRAFSGVIH